MTRSVRALSMRETAIIKSYKAEAVAFTEFAVVLHYPETKVAEKYEVRLRRINHLQHVDRFASLDDAVTMMNELTHG